MIQKTLGIPTLSNNTRMWGGIIRHYFRDCLACCWPNIYAKIHWDEAYTSLTSPALALSTQPALQDAMVATLYKLPLLSGKHCLIALYLVNHLSHKPMLPDELFKDACRIYDQYQEPALTLVIYTDPHPKISTSYQTSVLDYPVHQFSFQAVTLSDWHKQTAQLLKSPNVFAVMVSLYLQTKTLPKEIEKQYQLKINLFCALLDNNPKKEDILNFYVMIDSMIPLPASLQSNYHKAIRELEQQKTLNYITHLEKYGIEQGFQQGFQSGLEHANREHVKRLLSAGIDRTIIKKVLQMNDKELNRLMILENFG